MDDLDSSPYSSTHADLLAELRRRGVASSAQLQQALGKSQPTLSRALRELSNQVLVLGQQRSARYALPQDILGLPARQPLVWCDEHGARHDWGWLTHLGAERVHVEAPGIDVTTRGQLPWFLATLRLQGFLGRLWGRSPLAVGYDSNPERWRIDQLLALLLREVRDVPGAISLGREADSLAPTGAATPNASTKGLPLPARLAQHDAQAEALIHFSPAGSSAAGEQSKFISNDGAGQLIVKFTPPRGTPFGERWHDLLHAEALALLTLAEHGVAVAATCVVESPRRTYLESTRFDRIGAAGRRHIVPLEAVHAAFVPGPRQHWAASCKLLARQRRLPSDVPGQVNALMHFGRLIGNSDMHFGNLSLAVATPEDVARGRFTLAPVYDMLPMRWRPDVHSGGFDWLPFTPEPHDLASAARPVALRYWQRVEAHAAIGKGLRGLAATMAHTLARPAL